MLLIDPYRSEVGLDIRQAGRWNATQLTRLDEPLVIPSCGLRCLVADLYDGTPLNRKPPLSLGSANPR